MVSIPRIALALIAVVAVALAAGGVPFDGQGDSPEQTETPTPVDVSETPTPPPAAESTPFRWLLGAGWYLFVGTLGVLLLVAAVAVYRALSGPSVPESDPAIDRDREESDVAPPELDAVGGAAGRAADRLQRDGTLDNEVYRAWKEMTDHLRVSNRPARTPGEFVDAAERAGMDREDVSDLTALFESARYGTADPTEADERRAVELLRRIESKYGGDRG